MYKCGFYVCFIVSVIVCSVDCAKERCDGSCIRADSCRFFGNLQKEEQTIWLGRFVCEESSNKPPGTVFGFSSSAKGDIVCCPENIWQIDNSTVEEQTGGNYQTAGSNTEDSFPLEKNSFFSNYNRPNQNYAYPSNGGNGRYEDPRYQNQNANNGLATDDETNLYENTRIWQNRRRQQPVENPYFLAANQNLGNSFRRPETNSNGRQCAVTSFPPDPDSGCCGREATDADRNTASQYPQGNPVYTTQSNWMPQKNQPSPGSWQSWSPYSDRTKRDGGNVNVTFDNRIAGGKETELEQFPWTVLLKTTFVYPTKEASFSCGGSLISSRYVLTAGHCVYDDQGSIKDVEIYLAEYDKRTFPRDCKNVLGRGQQCIDNIVMHAENVHLHPQYDDNRLHNDISLIRLRGSAPYTDYIRPICLPTMNVDSPQLSNLRLAVAGWGRNGQYKSNIKQSTIVNLVPQSDCRSSYPGLTRQQLCAAGYTGEDTCKGDSGGPLMMVYGGKYFVAGVVSGKRADAPCGTSVPSLYTNVYQYLQWIRSIIQN